MVNQIHLMEMSIQVTAQMFWVTSNYFDLKKKKSTNSSRSYLND